MQNAVQKGQSKIERIMTIRNDNETSSLIGKRLHEIVENCLQIDISAAAMGASKRQKLENDEAQNFNTMTSTQMTSSTSTSDQRQFQMNSQQYLQNHNAKIDHDRQLDIQRQNEQRKLEQ